MQMVIQQLGAGGSLSVGLVVRTRWYIFIILSIWGVILKFQKNGIKK
jgi:hypothetical protein